MPPTTSTIKPSLSALAHQINLTDFLFLIAFFFLLIAGNLLQVLGVEDLPSFENRRLAIKSTINTTGQLIYLPQATDKYLNDHFAQRNRLIHYFYHIRLNVLKETVFPSVVVGDNDWLYYTDERNMEDFQHSSEFTEKQLSQISKNLESMSHHLRKNHIHLVVAVAPNKETIYPENVPDYIPRVEGESRLDQLMNYLKANGKIEVLDLRPALLSARKAYPVYYRTDTHWNSIGAYYAYQAIMDQIQQTFSQVKAKPLQDFNFEPSVWSGDLANFLTMRNILFEQTSELTPKFIPRSKTIIQNHPNRFEGTREISDSNLPRAVLIHDSFGLALIPFLAEHFQRITNQFAPYSFQPIPLMSPKLIEEEKPNIVIFIITERYLQLLLW